jgi:UDP-N-acetyl-D-mannosaminuronic acid dehydrogenase
MQEDNRICILGMGYVGLTLGAALCDRDFEVQGIEINPRVLRSLAEGKAHFFEQGLDRVLQRGLRNKRLAFSSTIPKDREFDVYIITVGTPLGEKGPRMDMVESVTRDIAAHMRDGALVLLRSTVKLGTSLGVVDVPRAHDRGQGLDRAFHAAADCRRQFARSYRAGGQRLSTTDADHHRGLRLAHR